MIIAIKGTRMAAATELLLDAKLYPGLLLMGSELSGGAKEIRHLIPASESVHSHRNSRGGVEQ